MDKLIMKSGFNNVTSDEISEDVKESKLQLTSLITVFMENSMKTAEIYTKHSNRKTITSKDITISLKREMFTFLNNDDIEERALQIYQEFKQEIEPSNSEDETSEEYTSEDESIDEDIDPDPLGNFCHIYDKKNNLDNKDNKDNNKDNKDNNEDDIEDDSEDFKKSTCECNICVEANKYNEQWKDWKPSNNIEEILHSAIENIDSKFNLL